MQKVSYLLQKEMTRKEFLATLGFGVATMFGFSSLMQMLGKTNPLMRSAAGYSSGSYGGIPKSRAL